MARAHDPWKFFVGDTWKLAEVMCDDFDEPIDITGVSNIEWRLNSADGLVNHLTLTLGDGISIIDADTGLVLVDVADEKTILLKAGEYRDQLRLFVGPDVQVQTYGIITAVDPLGNSKLPLSTQLAGVGTLNAQSIVQ